MYKNNIDLMKEVVSSKSSDDIAVGSRGGSGAIELLGTIAYEITGKTIVARGSPDYAYFDDIKTEYSNYLCYCDDEISKKADSGKIFKLEKESVNECVEQSNHQYYFVATLVGVKSSPKPYTVEPFSTWRHCLVWSRDRPNNYMVGSLDDITKQLKGYMVTTDVDGYLVYLHSFEDDEVCIRNYRFKYERSFPTEAIYLTQLVDIAETYINDHIDKIISLKGNRTLVDDFKTFLDKNGRSLKFEPKLLKKGFGQFYKDCAGLLFSESDYKSKKLKGADHVYDRLDFYNQKLKAICEYLNGCRGNEFNGCIIETAETMREDYMRRSDASHKLIKFTQQNLRALFFLVLTKNDLEVNKEKYQGAYEDIDKEIVKAMK